jgi:uncharacterized phage-associated protein
MATVKDVAAYILSRSSPMSAMKLQKLCYYSYCYHLAWEDRRLFRERFEAWANGPVSPVLYAEHRRRYELRDGDVPGKPSALDHGEKESVDIVLRNMDSLTAHQLSEMTHRETPWLEARKRAGAAPLERSKERLSDDDIADFFGALITNSD